MNTAGNQDTSGKSATATALATARNINGVSFDGTEDITVTAAGSTLSNTVPVSKGGTGTTTLDNLITLGDHTTGSYIATIADSGSNHITVNNSGGETAAITLSITNNSIGLEEMAGITRGSIITGDQSSDPSYLSIGSENKVLTSDGTDPSWTSVTNNMLANSSLTVSAGSGLTTDSQTISLGGSSSLSVNVDNSSLEINLSLIHISEPTRPY